MNIDELKRSINKAREECVPKVLVIINPGNPTGSVLTRQNIEDVIKFAKNEKLLIIADEVYQHNIWDGEFFSFKKVMHDLKIEIELASVMSASKGKANQNATVLQLVKINVYFCRLHGRMWSKRRIL